MPHADEDDVSNDEQPATRAPGRRPPRRAVVGVLLVLVVLGSLLVSAALFSDVARNEGLRLGAGTVDVATAPVTLALDAMALAPGDVVATPLEVRNDGSLELRYSITSTVDDTTLGDLLRFEVRVGVSSCDAVGADQDGTLIAGPVRLGGATADPLVGDPATGQDPGDRVLGPGASEVLCLRVELPAETSEEEGAGRTVTATLQVDAEQTTANP